MKKNAMKKNTKGVECRSKKFFFGIPLKFCGDIWRRVRKDVGHAGRIKGVRNIW
jgi:hypothetical protein